MTEDEAISAGIASLSRAVNTMQGAAVVDISAVVAVIGTGLAISAVVDVASGGSILHKEPVVNVVWGVLDGCDDFTVAGHKEECNKQCFDCWLHDDKILFIVRNNN